MNRLKQIMARLGRFTAAGFVSKLLTVRDLLSLAFHSTLAAIVIFGGFWADFAIALYLVAVPLLRISRRLALF